MELSISRIAELIGGVVEGSGEEKVNQLKTLEDAQPGSISFLHNPKYESLIYSTKASAVIVSREFNPKETLNTSLIRVDDPYTGFTRLLEAYQEMLSMQKTGVEEPAFMDASSSIGANHYRGAFSYIGKNSTLGDHAKLYPHVFIGDNVNIGDHVTLYPGVKIYDNTVIGNHCTVHAGSVVGSDGFGFAPQEDGSYKAIPQVGNVVLHDYVSIGANTVIDCATLESTIIGQGTKLDNLIQIGHNVEIGKNTVMAAQAGVSGSSRIGDSVVIAGQVGVTGHLKIGDRVTLAAQSGVTKNIKDDMVVLGSPAYDIRDYRRSYVVFRKLPDLERKLLELEEKMLNLRTFEE